MVGKAPNALVCAVAIAGVQAMDNSLARTPPMGWSSWNCFGGAQSQDKMEAVAQAIVSTGLRELGYVNLAVDGGWRSFQKGGPPVPGTGYVGPAGWNFTQLAATYHALGLKLGMYVTGGFEAVFGHEEAWADGPGRRRQPADLAPVVRRGNARRL